MNRLEQRVNKLEEAVPGLPCPNPEHQGLAIFVKGVSEEKDREVDRLLKSLDECEHCSKDQGGPGPTRVIIRLEWKERRCPTCGAAMDDKNGEATCNEPH